MKRLAAYVNTMRVHWLVEELQKIGIPEIMVTEIFKSHSQGSRCEFLCADDLVDSASVIVREIGTRGNAEGHALFVLDYDDRAIDNIPLGRRISVLQKGFES